MKVRVAYGADTIEIIDSIPKGEGQTARRLSEHVRDLQYDPAVMQVPVTLHRVANSAELRALLSRLADYAKKNDSWPLIHIESHGDTNGIQLVNCEYVRWIDFQPIFLTLNKATRNHLFIVMSACSGFHGIKAMLSASDDVASLRMLIGPTQETTSGKLEDAMRAFYDSLLKTGNVVGALAEAQRHEPTFRGHTADEAFIAGWRKALKEHPVVMLMSLDMNVPFESHKRKFFMLDLFPEVGTELTGVTPPME